MRCVLLVLGLAFFAGCLATNISVLVRYLRSGTRSSMIPVLGGIVGAGALVVSPAAELRPFWWLPMLLDPGCALWLVEVMWTFLRTRRGKPDV